MDDKLRKLINGGRAIVSDAWIERFAQTDFGSEIVTAHNRHRCGVLDAYVAWIGNENRPGDLEIIATEYGQRAVASI